MESPRPASSIGLVEEALKAHAGRLRELAARARAGGDPDLVHDTRVELRRLEALSRLYRGVPRKRDGDAVRETARALRRQLSPLRSEEVGRALLAARSGDAVDGLAPLVFPGALVDLRVEPSDLVPVSRAVSGWRRRLAAAFGGAFSPRAEEEADLRERSRRRLRRRLGDLLGLLPPKAGTLHPARIAAKRVRYAVEAAGPLVPGARPLLRLLRAFQDAAGDAHDLAELAARVRAAGAADPAVAAATEELASDLEADAGRVLSAARQGGSALVAPVRRLRAALARSETR